jgi:hypothetical protein
MGLPVPPSPREDGLGIYKTEEGERVVVEVGKMRIIVEGADDPDEVAEIVTAALERLARKRGKLPRKTEDRTARGLRDALRQP